VPLLLAGGGVMVMVVLLVSVLLLWPKGSKVSDKEKDKGGVVQVEDKKGGKTDDPGSKPVRPVLDFNQEKPATMTGHGQSQCLSVAFMPDGLRAVTQNGGYLYHWDLQNRSLMSDRQYLNAGTWEGLVTISPDARWIASSASHQLVLLDGKSKPLGSPEAMVTILGLNFSADSSLLAISQLGRPSSVTIRDMVKPTRATLQTLRYGGPVIAMALSPDGKYLLTSNVEQTSGLSPLNSGEKSMRLRLWEKNREIREIAGHTAIVTHVAFSADGKRIYSASAFDGTLRVWNNEEGSPNAGKEIRQVVAGKNVAESKWLPTARDPAQMACVCFWPGGRALIGYTDGSVGVWDLETGKDVRFPSIPNASVSAIAISPDGHHALAAMTDGLLYLYRLPPPVKR
jgi:WD40 repeat protein